jgi:hypothetical protein
VLDLVGVQEVRWEAGGTNWQGNNHFSMERGMRIMNLLFLSGGVVWLGSTSSRDIPHHH